MAAPQVLTMGGIDAPSWVGAVLVLAGVGTAFGLSALIGLVADRLAGLAAAVSRYLSIPRGDGFLSPLDPFEMARAMLVAGAIAALLIVAAAKIQPSPDPTNPADPAAELMMYFPHLVWLSLIGAALSIARLGRGWTLLGCGIAAGLAAWAATSYVGYADLTQQAIHYEVPKSVEYWLPVMLAVGAAGALAAVIRERRLGLARPVAIGLFLVVAMYPTTQPLATNVQIGEHRGSESVGLALREAELGYWSFNGYPDARLIIDQPRQQVRVALFAQGFDKN